MPPGQSLNQSEVARMISKFHNQRSFVVVVVVFDLMSISVSQIFVVNFCLLHRCFSRFWNCINGTKSRNAPYLLFCLRLQLLYFKCWSFVDFAVIMLSFVLLYIWITYLVNGHCKQNFDEWFSCIFYFKSTVL